MRNIRRRLKKLRKSFPSVQDNGPYPKLVRAAALRRLSTEDLLVLSSVAKAQEERSPVPPWNEPELRVVEAYTSALALEP